MPNPWDLTPEQASFWSAITRSAHEHATTAEVWDAIKSEAARMGVPVPQGMFTAVNRMRMLAGSAVRSQSILGRVADDTPLTGQMVGQAIYSRGLDALGIVPPQYHAYVQITQLIGGEEVQQWGVIPYGTLPATVGELREDADAYASSFSQEYNALALHVDAIELVAW